MKIPILRDFPSWPAKGEGLRRPEDYATALRLFLPLAEQGFAPAQNNLGAMYGNGQGVSLDYAERAADFFSPVCRAVARRQVSVLLPPIGGRLQAGRKLRASLARSRPPARL